MLWPVFFHLQSTGRDATTTTKRVHREKAMAGVFEPDLTPCRTRLTLQVVGHK